MKKRCLFIFLWSIGALVLSGCMTPYDAKGGEESEGEIEGEEVSTGGGEEGDAGTSSDSLFVKGEDGIIRFKVNDDKYWSVNGYSLWKFSKNEECSEVEIVASKQSGDPNAGYGLVCYRNKEGEAGAEKKDVMLCVLINVRGEYAFGKVDKGIYKHIKWWKKYNGLQRGYNVENRIGVKRDGEDIQILLNGEVVEALKDNEEPHLKEKGEYGYIAIISGLDTFPQKSVEIYYKDGEL